MSILSIKDKCLFLPCPLCFLVTWYITYSRNINTLCQTSGIPPSRMMPSGYLLFTYNCKLKLVLVARTSILLNVICSCTVVNKLRYSLAYNLKIILIIPGLLKNSEVYEFLKARFIFIPENSATMLS